MNQQATPAIDPAKPHFYHGKSTIALNLNASRPCVHCGCEASASRHYPPTVRTYLAAQAQVKPPKPAAEEWASLYAWLGRQAESCDAEYNELSVNLDENVGNQAMAEAYREVQRRMRKHAPEGWQA